MVQTLPARPAVAWVDDELCMACRYCDARKICRTKAIMQIDPGESPFVDVHRCMGCLDCVDACPHGAIRSANGGGRPH